MSLDPRRAGRLTASMVGAAIGVNKYCSRQKAWRLAVGKENFEGNEMTAWGNNYESEACKSYEVETGEIVQESLDSQRFYLFEDWLGATPDGKTNDFLIEFKCPFFQKIPDEVPDHYMAQIQVGMQLVGMDACHLVYWTLQQFVIFEVQKDIKYYEQILPLMKDFYSDMQKKEPPKRQKKPKLLKPKQEIILNERN
tara:strand:+ start:233 stop:820 length:588 start_codon:yes stop_codon:yes gene_type:complete